MVMKLKVTVNGDEFSFDGEATPAEILPALTRWFEVRTQSHQELLERLQAVTDRVNQTKQDLKDAADQAS